MPATSKRVSVIGTGLGGLLTGAWLARQGYRVTFLEQLSLVGGRFTHIDFEGFAVPTGAFHTLPGGRTGPISRCLRVLDIEPELVEASPSFVVISHGHRYPVHVRKRQRSGIRDAAQIGGARLALRLAGVGLRRLAGIDTSIARLVKGLSPDDVAVRVFDHITKFSSGVGAESASIVEILRSLAAHQYGTEGFLKRGNRGLVSSILENAIEHGAGVRTGVRVAEIVVRDGHAIGVRTEDGELVEADIVVSNAGAARTLEMLGGDAPRRLLERIGRATPVHGAAHAIRCRRQMQDHAAVEIPVDLDLISGITPISNVCPDLCPEGWSYSLAYQALTQDAPVAEQVDRGANEIKAYLGSDAEVFNTAIYRGEHPAAYMAQSVGQYGRSRFDSSFASLRGLYLVGQDATGYGTAAETIGDSCLRLWRRLR